MAASDGLSMLAKGSDNGDVPVQVVTNEHEKAVDRIMKILRQVAECLDDAEVAEIKQILSQVVELCKKKDSQTEQKVNELYLRFLNMVEFRAGISVNLIMQAIRCFLEIEDDPEGVGTMVSEQFLAMILTEHPALAIDMQLTDELMKVYFKLLSEGKEEFQHIRLMVVGMYGVGKTTLIRQLCHLPTKDVKSTVGIDIFTDTCEVDENSDWKISNSEEKSKLLNQRLHELLTKYRNPESTKSKQENTTQVVPPKTKLKPQPQPSDTQLGSMQYKKFEKKMSAKQTGSTSGTTAKIEVIKEITKKEERLERRPTVSIWDFAGQSVYYSTHHFFLNQRSIYILVLNLSKDLHEKVKEENTMKVHSNLNLGNTMEGYTCLDAFKFWLKSIYIYTQQSKILSISKQQGNIPSNSEKIVYQPKVLLVGTFKDKIPKERNLDEYKDKYFEKALKSFINTPVIELIHKKKFLISNSESSDEDFLAIKKEILHISKGMPFWNEPVPAKLIPLEREVFHNKENKQQIMRFSDLKKVGENSDYPDYTDDEIKVFLALQHAFGNVLYYDMGLSDEMIILTPQWIIDAFKAFVSHKSDKEGKEMKYWDVFEEYGRLKHQLIDSLLKQNKLFEYKDDILTYMKHLEVIAKPVTFKDGKDHSLDHKPGEFGIEYYFLDSTMRRETEEEDFFVMPCMLPPKPKEDKLKELFKDVGSTTHTPTLCICITKGILPSFVLHCLFATALKELPVAYVSGTKILYNGLGSFKLTETRRLTIWSVDSIIHLRVTFTSEQEKQEDQIEYCRSLRDRFEKLVLKLFNFHGKETYKIEKKSELYDLRVKCPHCPEQVPFEEKKDAITGRPVDYIIGLLNMKGLEYMEEKTCGNCNKVTNFEDVKHWFKQEIKDVNHEDTEEDKRLKEKPTECQLADIACLVGQYQVWACKLQINDTRLGQLCHDYPHPFTNLVYHILLDWKKQNDCYKILYDALLETQKDELFRDKFLRKIAGENDPDEEKQIKTCMNIIGCHGDECRELTETLISKLSQEIGDEYWLLGIRLGTTESQMQRLWIECGKKISEVCRQFLLGWNKEGKPLKDLVTALVKSSCHGAVWDILKKC